MRYSFFFCILYFLLVGYFIRPEPQTSTLFTFFFSYLPNIDKHRRVQLYQLQRGGAKVVPCKR